MKKIISALFILIAFNTVFGQKDKGEAKDYIEFDDRKNVVHGVYMGLTYHYGRINNEDAHFNTLKIAYVANRKFEAGIVFGAFYSKQAADSGVYTDNEAAIAGAYGGLHLEPILFSNRFINVSFPILIGEGVVTLLNEKIEEEYIIDDGFDGDFNENYFDKSDYTAFFMFEPGINILYNISRYVQIETGIRYRFTGKYDLPPFEKDNLNGFSVGAGIKLGVFNLGRKKKPIKDGFN